MRLSGLSIGVAVVFGLIGFCGYSISATTEACIVSARSLLAAADPMDRVPAPRVVALVGRWISAERMPGAVASILLDRFGCGVGAKWAGPDWLIERPALTWQIGRSFTSSDLIALFVSTMDTGAPAFGLSSGARKFYRKPVNELDDAAVSCLFDKANGNVRRWNSCGNEYFPPTFVP